MISPIEMIPIRHCVPEFSLPPENAARRSESERAPQETALPHSVWGDKVMDAGVLDQPSSLLNPSLVSGRVQESFKSINAPKMFNNQPATPMPHGGPVALFY
jgi:hypothetical protein